MLFFLFFFSLCSQEEHEEEVSETVGSQTDFLPSNQQSSFLWSSPCADPRTNQKSCNLDLKKVKFSCEDSFETVRDLGGSTVTHQGVEIFGGYRQVSGNNQNPILAAFQNGEQIWCREDYESAGDDGTTLGLFSDGNLVLGAFSCTGHQGDKSQDFRRFAEQGWMSSYGAGGGSKISILAVIDPATGDISLATFVSAILKNGNSNSLTISHLERLEDGNIKVYAKTKWAPRNPDRSRMECSQDPENHYLVFKPDLSEVIESYALYCTGDID